MSDSLATLADSILSLAIQTSDSIELSYEQPSNNPELSSSPLQPKELSQAAHPSKWGRVVEGYAEFLRLMIRHRVPILVDLAVAFQDGLSPLAQGGTFVVRWGSLRKEVLSPPWRPFALKCHRESRTADRVLLFPSVEPGATVVCKHVNFQTLAAKGLKNSDFLEPFTREALILSHPMVRNCLFLPGLIAMGVETSPYDVGEMPKQFPYLVQEFGRGGNMEDWIRGLSRAANTWVEAERPFDFGTDQLREAQKPADDTLLRWEHTIQDHILSWKLKIHLCLHVSKALQVLHRIGVVHGDVKLTNVIICGPRLEHFGDFNDSSGSEFLDLFVPCAQLCDFGSSILLSDFPVGGTAKLISYSPPWNAPEATTQLDRDDITATDIYSYGLLFSRIMLQGNDPFDEKYHISFSTHSRDDDELVSKLKKDDAVVDHVMSRLKHYGLYTEEQLVVIETVLNRTIRTSPSDRAGDMSLITDFLTLALDLEQIDRMSSFAWCDTGEESSLSYPLEKASATEPVQRGLRLVTTVDPTPEMEWNLAQESPLGPWRDGKTFSQHISDSVKTKGVDFEVHLAHAERFDDSLDLRCSDEGEIANLLDPLFSYVLIHRLFVREMFQDLQGIADHEGPGTPGNGSMQAEAAFQVALCYLHGWGVAHSVLKFTEYFKLAVLKGSRHALETMGPMSEAMPLLNFLDIGTSELTIIKSKAEEAMCDALRRHADLSLAKYLDRTCPDRFSALLHEIRTNYLQGNFGRRLRISSDNVEHLLDMCVKGELPESTKQSLLGLSPNFHSILLHYASMAGNVGALEHIIEEVGEGPEMAIQRLGLLNTQSPLLLACANGHAFAAIYLLEKGANPRTKDQFSRTPLHFLASFDPEMIINVGCLLLEHGALLDAVDEDGLTPSSSALDHERNFVPRSGAIAAGFLLEKGATWDKFSGRSWEISSSSVVQAIMAWDQPSIQEVHEHIGKTLATFQTESVASHDIFSTSPSLSFRLQQSIALRRWATEPAFIRARKIGSQGPQSANMMRARIGYFLRTHTVEQVLLLALLQPSIDIAIPLGLSTRDGWPQDNIAPLVITGKQGNFQIASWLLRQGTKFDATGKDNTNILHIAAMNRWPTDEVRRLCQAQETSVDLNAMANGLISGLQINPFDAAVICGHFTMAEFLRELGADTTSAHCAYTVGDKPELTILGCVVRPRSKLPDACTVSLSLKYLLSLNLGPVASESAGFNVFHVCWVAWEAVTKTKFDPETKDPFDEVITVFEILWEHFADKDLIKAVDHMGNTPLHYAAASLNIRGVKRLIELGADVNAHGIQSLTALDMVTTKFVGMAKIAERLASGELEPSGGTVVSNDIQMYLLLDLASYLLSAGGASGASLKSSNNLVSTTSSLTLTEGKATGRGQLRLVLPRELLRKADVPAGKIPSLDGKHGLSEKMPVIFIPPAHRRDLGLFRVCFYFTDEDKMIFGPSTSPKSS